MKELADKANALAREIKGDELSKRVRETQAAYEEIRRAREGLKQEESALVQKISGTREHLESLEKEILKKQESKTRMEKYTKYDRWIREFFTKLMGTIERHVMVNIQHEFNSLFQKWFSMLVMDENLNARVDADFSVIIEQNGFETDYSFLSGGERTAVALAYRLALNRVINDLTEKIKTKDLLILDEPTDGFSTEQMNSVRDVLDELNTRQTLIVSHEPKIEAFVDRTVRFVKEEGLSRLA
jgi:exonuclease SbcC